MKEYKLGLNSSKAAALMIPDIVTSSNPNWLPPASYKTPLQYPKKQKIV